MVGRLKMFSYRIETNEDVVSAERFAQLGSDEITFDVFSPHFVCPSPPIFPPTHSEVFLESNSAHFDQLEWIHPNLYNHTVSWDYSIVLEPEQDVPVGSFFTKAFKGPLLPQQTKVLPCPTITDLSEL